MNKTHGARQWKESATVLLAACLLLTACSKSKGVKVVEKSATEYTDAGWSQFGRQTYDSALVNFDSAVVMDGSYSEAYLGAGWANFYLRQFGTAMLRLSVGKGHANDSLIADFFAGLSLGAYEQEDYTSSIKWADSCLARKPSYSFAHLSSVNWVDLLVLKANASFQIGGDANLMTAANLCNDITSRSICPGIPASLHLDPANPDSWIVDGNQYYTFSGALVKALEKIADIAKC